MNTHTYAHTPFSISWTNANPSGWEKNAVEVFRDGVRIGGYWRNYGMVAKTFCPFRVGDTWYALYSKDYTATRVARLTDTFEDWCGEDPSGAGFCPVEFFVPLKFQNTYTSNGEKVSYDVWLDAEYESETEFNEEAKDKPLRWADFGFVSGCIWGDDSSWKLRHLDLSGIPEKRLIITEKFGYWELAGNIRESVRMYGHGRIGLTGQFTMDLNKPVPNEQFTEGFFRPCYPEEEG